MNPYLSQVCVLYLFNHTILILSKASAVQTHGPAAGPWRLRLSLRIFNEKSSKGINWNDTVQKLLFISDIYKLKFSAPDHTLRLSYHISRDERTTNWSSLIYQKLIVSLANIQQYNDQSHQNLGIKRWIFSKM